MKKVFFIVLILMASTIYSQVQLEEDVSYSECLIKTSDNILSKEPREKWTEEMFKEEKAGNYKQGYFVVCKPQGWSWGNLERDPARFMIITIPTSEINNSWFETELDIKGNISTRRQYKTKLFDLLTIEEMNKLLQIEYNEKVNWTLEKNFTTIKNYVYKNNYSDRVDDLILHGSSGTFYINTSGGNYTTLAALESGEQADLRGSGFMKAIINEGFTEIRTSAIDFNGWTTDADDYIWITTEGEGRHKGQFNESYYLLYASSTTVLTMSEDYFTVEGLQIKSNSTSSNNVILGDAFQTSGRMNATGNILMGSAKIGISFDADTAVHLLINNVFVNISKSFGECITAGHPSGLAEFDIFSNSFYNVYIGVDSMDSTANISNNIAQACSSSCFSGTPGFASNNIASDGTAPGKNSFNNTIVAFRNRVAGDLHLLSNETNAIDGGLDLSYLYQDDIDQEERTGTWDIGADEYVSEEAPPVDINCSYVLNVNKQIDDWCNYTSEHFNIGTGGLNITTGGRIYLHDSNLTAKNLTILSTDTNTPFLFVNWSSSSFFVNLTG